MARRAESEAITEADSWRRRLVAPIVIVLIAGSLTLGWTSAAQKSATHDESAYLPNGLLFLSSGRTTNAGVPPLAMALVALPVHAGGVKLAWEDLPPESSFWQVGFHFMQGQDGQGRSDYPELFRSARSVALAAFGLLLLAVCGYAYSLYGPGPAILATALAAFSPNLLAHGRLATTDVFFALFFTLVLWSLDALSRRPTWLGAVGLGVALGLANLSKFSAVLLYALIPLAVVSRDLIVRVRRGHQDSRATRSLGPKLVLAGIVSCATIQVGYLGYAGIDLPRLGSLAFQSDLLQTVQRALPSWIPSPWPSAFLSAFDWQFAEGRYQTYLFGEIWRSTLPNYFLVALAVKVPLLTFATWVAVWFKRPGPSARELIPLGFVVGYFVVISVFGHKNIGFRYLLFVIPILAVVSSRAVCSARLDRTRGSRAIAALAIAAAVWNLSTCLVIWPDYLPYFNSLAGGPAGGHKVLLDSNLDWGQDLPALEAYMDREGIESIDLAFAGRVDPARYGIRYQLLGGSAPKQRYLAVSANFLYGLEYYVNGSVRWLDNPDSFASLRDKPPDTILGHTLYVWDAARILQEERRALHQRDQELRRYRRQLRRALDPSVPVGPLLAEDQANVDARVKEHERAIRSRLEDAPTEATSVGDFSP